MIASLISLKINFTWTVRESWCVSFMDWTEIGFISVEKYNIFELYVNFD